MFLYEKMEYFKKNVLLFFLYHYGRKIKHYLNIESIKKRMR